MVTTWGVADEYISRFDPVEMKLVLKKGDHWGAEHCFKLKAQSQVKYQFSAQVDLSFDFHLHPQLPDGGYRTEHFAKQKAVQSYRGQARASHSGMCCFHFYAVKPLSRDREILLTYEVKAAQGER